jgi:hypothetical protein
MGLKAPLVRFRRLPSAIEKHESFSTAENAEVAEKISRKNHESSDAANLTDALCSEFNLWVAKSQAKA